MMREDEVGRTSSWSRTRVWEPVCVMVQQLEQAQACGRVCDPVWLLLSVELDKGERAWRLGVPMCVCL